MRSFFKFLKWLILVLLVLGGLGLALAWNITRLNEEARDYAQEAVPTIFTKWDSMALYDRASPEFKSVMTLDKVYEIFRRGSALGPLEKADPPIGAARVFYDFKKGKTISAQFTTNAEFARGAAAITIGLVKQGEQWLVQSFNVQSPDLGGFAPSAAAAESSPGATASSTTLRSPSKPTSTVEEAQREAVRLYPDIGVEGSRLNLEFLARHKRYQKEKPEYFRNASWPLQLAEESARAIQEN